MEQDVDNTYRPVCTTCLSTDRNLFLINGVGSIYQIFRLLMYDFAVERLGDTLAEMEQLICWECLALMKRFARFKQQVQSAQEHLRVLALSRTQESMDHTYMSQSLSSLEMSAKVDYDKIFFDYTTQEWPQPYIAVTHSVKNEQYDVAQAVRENINLDMDDHLLEVPEMVLENPVTGVMSHVVVGTDAFVTQNDAYTHVKGELPELTVTESQLSQDGTITQTLEPVLLMPKPHKKEEPKPAYLTEYMSEADMMATRGQVRSTTNRRACMKRLMNVEEARVVCQDRSRWKSIVSAYPYGNQAEEAKLKIQYASSVYKCELCIIGFYTQQQVEDHFVTAHRAKPGLSACKVCYTYVAESALETHVASHYWRYTCKMCRHTECSAALMGLHVAGHLLRPVPNNVLQVVASPAKRGGAGRKKKLKREAVSTPPKPGDLRKLLSKTTIEGYQCLECDMFFKNSRARKNHVARYHREGLQCDHCKKRFVNRTTLATHLRLHEGPLPREECPICHKMVRSIQIKYHIRRHQNKSRYECTDCNKLFSHLATYQAHLKYSRAHASDYVFKFPCPMCNKGYPTKEQMQDHFNYQHLGKTSHKCPVCDKPIASRANVDKHMLRVHGEKKEKPRNHTCQVCGKSFTDKKALTQHAVIHSGDRPLSCEVCQQTFKQKASLYTHRKRVHKLFPSKRLVEFMDSKPDNAG